MADAAAAKREARRRRILENSENRMQRIFGVGKDEEPNGVNSETFKPLSKPQIDNGFKSTNNHSEDGNKVIQEKKTNSDVLEQEINSKKAFEYSEIKSQYSQPDNHSAFRHTDEQYTLKNKATDCDNLEFKPMTTTLFEQAPCKQDQSFLLTTLFFSPLSCILLAIFVNILLLADVNFSLYKGIITPYIVLAITRLCLQNKSEESQGSNMLVAALILCNIKPEIVYTFKKVIGICSTISRDFALYLTSFVLFNLIVSVLWTGSNFVQFF